MAVVESTETAKTEDWHTTACILCSINCGIEVKLDGRGFERIRGDKAHPTSQGYTPTTPAASWPRTPAR